MKYISLAFGGLFLFIGAIAFLITVFVLFTEPAGGNNTPAAVLGVTGPYILLGPVGGILFFKELLK